MQNILGTFVVLFQTLCFHLGMTDAFVWDAGTDQERMTEWPETKQILTEIHQEIEKDNRQLIYSHQVNHLLKQSCFYH